MSFSAKGRRKGRGRIEKTSVFIWATFKPRRSCSCGCCWDLQQQQPREQQQPQLVCLILMRFRLKKIQVSAASITNAFVLSRVIAYRCTYSYLLEAREIYETCKWKAHRARAANATAQREVQEKYPRPEGVDWAVYTS